MSNGFLNYFEPLYEPELQLWPSSTVFQAISLPRKGTPLFTISDVTRSTSQEGLRECGGGKNVEISRTLYDKEQTAHKTEPISWKHICNACWVDTDTQEKLAKIKRTTLMYIQRQRMVKPGNQDWYREEKQSITDQYGHYLQPW